MFSLSSTFQRGVVGCVLPHPTTEIEFRSMYLLDMILNPGNSGGPVFLEEDGTVVSVVHATPRDIDSAKDSRGTEAGLYYWQPSGLTHAVPVNSRLLETIESVRKVSLGQAARLASDLGESFEAKKSKFAPSLPMPLL